MELALPGGVAQEQGEEWGEEAAWEQVVEREEWAALEQELARVENVYVQSAELQSPIKLVSPVPKQCVQIAER